MKKLIALGLACLAALALTPATAADTVVSGPGLAYPPNVFLYQARAVDLSTAYTNATTTPTKVTSASGTTEVSIPATTGDISKQFFRVCYSIDGTKGTATTGAVQVYANGAVIAASKRYITSAAGQGTISACYTVARASKDASTVSLYAVSGDTNTFTINAAYIEVWNVILN